MRATPGPINVLAGDGDLAPEQAELLKPRDQKSYQELVGTFGWLAGARPDIRYNTMLLSKQCKAPRRWDMQCAIWMLQYLRATADAPLVLGGPVLDPQATSDSSFATMGERETVYAYGVTTGPLSGVIEATSKVTKCAVTSVWETELIALAEAVKTEEFIVHACQELKYNIPPEHKVFSDNQGVQSWAKGDSSNRRSRHIDVRYWYVRHAERDGRVKLEFVSTAENYADILTKSFIPKEHKPLAARILGHMLVQGLDVPGVFDLTRACLT